MNKSELTELYLNFPQFKLKYDTVYDYEYMNMKYFKSKLIIIINKSRFMHQFTIGNWILCATDLIICIVYSHKRIFEYIYNIHLV